MNGALSWRPHREDSGTDSRGARVRGATAARLLAGVVLMLFGRDLAGPIGALAVLAFCAHGTVALLQPIDLAGAPPSPPPRDQDPLP